MFTYEIFTADETKQFIQSCELSIVITRVDGSC